MNGREPGIPASSERADEQEYTMAIPGMEDYPIKLGTLLFTMVEPEKGREVEYNRWYEHDHFYSGCMVCLLYTSPSPRDS